jgi:hypothetical protein
MSVTGTVNPSATLSVSVCRFNTRAKRVSLSHISTESKRNQRS